MSATDDEAACEDAPMDDHETLDAILDDCVARAEQMIKRNQTTLDRIDEGF